MEVKLHELFPAALFAAYQHASHSRILARIRAGLARARSQGKKLGRPPIAPELEERIRAALDKPGH
jgi:DNA invertase Pin-like site-specific DNA recombinase